jgi:DNA-directed RNA polymerase subunit beta
VIAQANADLDKNGKFSDELVSCRHRNEFTLSAPDKIEYIDVAPSQIVSVAASYPVLEHGDANRALMGSNISARRCLAFRRKAARGHGHPGRSRSIGHRGRPAGAGRRIVDAGRIVARVNDNETRQGEAGVDIYNLTKYTRSSRTPTSASARW